MFGCLISIFLYALLNLPVLLYIKDLRLYHGSVSIRSDRLGSPINIYRDEHDIPHIQAASLQEAFFGLGYVHAQDRLFTLSIKRLIFSGRLSEFFGDFFQEMDIYYRNLLLSYTCKENVKNLDQEDRQFFEYYIAGLNEFASSLSFLPNEFYIMGLPFEPFQIEDGLVLWKFLGYALTFDWQHEVFREKLAEFFTEEEAEEMTGAYSQYHFDKTVILNDEELKQSGLYEKFEGKGDNRTRRQVHPHHFSHHPHRKYVRDVLYDMMDTIDNMERGSNNWVIHGNHTKSGRPIMANDPHLDNHIPCLWYLAELLYQDDGQEKYVTGATLPGLPFIFVGKTQFFAWGSTTLHTDTSDIYREVLNEDGTKYLYEGVYYDLEVISEEIKIKGKDSIRLSVKRTRHGPILSSIQDIYNVDYELPNENISFAWIGYNSKDTTFKTLIGLYRLTNGTEEISRIFAGFVSPFMNIVYATESGDIGYYACGWLPVRENPEETFFLRGDLKENDWVGVIGNKQVPQIVNPEKGFIVTANNKLATDNIVFRKSLHMLPSSRALRIHQLLSGYIASGHKITLSDVKNMQFDVKDAYAELIVPKMIELIEKYSQKLGFNSRKIENIAKMAEILRKWDFEVSRDSVPASVYNYWEYKFLNRLLGRVLDAVDRERLVFSLNFEQFVLRKLAAFAADPEEIRGSVAWCENSEYPVPEKIRDLTCVYHLLDALEETYAFLMKTLGPETDQWHWGRLHQMKYRHVPFSEFSIGRLYEKEYPAPGSRRTVNVAIPNFRTHELDGVHSANLRLIVEIGGEAVWSFDTGVSENRFSWNYVEGMETHRKGNYWNMSYGKESLGLYEKRLELKKA